MEQHRDDILFKQSTFLEGIEVPQPCSSLSHETDAVSHTLGESETIEVTQKQVSWIAATVLLSSCLMFMGGYRLAKVHEEQRLSLPKDGESSVGSLELQEVDKKMYESGCFGRYEDAVQRYQHLVRHGKNASITKKVSRSLAGVERFWYLVNEVEKK